MHSRPQSNSCKTKRTWRFQLDYRITDVPLEPHEEIHLLQMVREAVQNAMHHSEGKHVVIRMAHLANSDDKIELAVEDDGVGIPTDPEKLNHYGLVIIKERGRHLGGDAEIKRREEGGTGVYFRFVPQYLQKEQLNDKSHLAKMV